MKKVKLLGVLLLALTFGVVSVKADETLQSRIDSAEGKLTIKLDNDYTEDLVIGENKDITLDLNGHTLTTWIRVNQGKLTVDDTASGGKIVNRQYSLEVQDGSFTLQNGTIESKKNYGIYGLHGSKITINGGSIVADGDYACLGSNNTTGNAEFIINGGVLTSKWQAIYLANPIGLTVNGGTINGGIVARMGIINISGGTINASTEAADQYDLIEDYYSLGDGYPWLSDAIAAMSGTYTTTSEEGNVLEINITGGTINTQNGVGSAVVIYDIGKVEQDIKVNITGDAVIRTNAESRRAYDILNLEDIGITSPKTGYGEHYNPVKTTITGGTFSSDITDFLDKVVYQQDEDGKVTEIEYQMELDGSNVPEDCYIASPDGDELQEALIDSLKNDANIDTEHRNVAINVLFEDKDAKELPEKIEEAVSKISEEAKVLKYFDLSFKVIDTDNQDELGNITSLTKKVKLSVVLPEEMPELKEGFVRKYYMIRMHGTEVEVLDADLNKEGTEVIFETDKFSEYALAYNDVEEKEEEKTTETKTTTEEKKEEVVAPKTLDSIVIYMIITIVTAALITYTSLYLKKRFNH